MSCDVAVLPFQVVANCETWSIDFGVCAENYQIKLTIMYNLKINSFLISNILLILGNFVKKSCYNMIL